MQNVAMQIAGKLQAIENCHKTGNGVWAEKHTEAIERLIRDHFPSGSGFDNGTFLDFEKSSPEKLIFGTSFHHMNDVGYYIGWTDHSVTVTPSLVYGFNMRIGGRDKRGIKDYIGQCFHESLSTLTD